jgi:argininosuccinate lyase
VLTDNSERDLTLETGGALAQLAFGISRTLTEMAFFKTKQMDSRSKLTVSSIRSF